MAAQIIDGKAVSAKVKEEVRQEIEREGLDVGLAVEFYFTKIWEIS